MWSMNRIKLLFFATLRDRVGTRTAEIEVPTGTTVGGLKTRLGELYPNAGPTIQTALIAINREYSREDLVIPENAEVALFPPVSGG